MINEFNLVIASVGGQGGLTLSRIIAEAALSNGYSVRTGETLGMSQRFGSVLSFVRFGKDVRGPLIPFAKADVLIGLELLEALRAWKFIGPKTLVLVAKISIPPVFSSLSHIPKWSSYKYPSIDDILMNLRKRAEKAIDIDALPILRKLNNVRGLNVFMLGIFAASPRNPIPKSLYEDAIRKVIKRNIELNIKTFRIGYDIGQRLEFT